MKIIRRILLVVCLAVFLYSAGNLLNIGYKYHKLDSDNNKLQEKVVTEVKQDSPLDRKIDFNQLKSINEDIILDLLNTQNYKCYYSGLDFNLSDVNGSPTIDRIDSSKGYIVGNIVIARNDINKMKSNYSFEHFKMLVNFVSKKIGGMEGVCL